MIVINILPMTYFAPKIQPYRGLQRSCTGKNQSATRMRVNSIATFLRILFTVDLSTPKLAHCFSEELLPAIQFASADEAHRKAHRKPWNSRMRVALSVLSVQKNVANLCKIKTAVAKHHSVGKLAFLTPQ